MAILFGWATHAVVLVGMDVLASGSTAAIRTTTVDECSGRLHGAGWSVGEACFMTDAGLVWQVDGTNGEKWLLARVPTQAGAWRQAVEQAAATGMLSR